MLLQCWPCERSLTACQPAALTAVALGEGSDVVGGLVWDPSAAQLSSHGPACVLLLLSPFLRCRIPRYLPSSTHSSQITRLPAESTPKWCAAAAVKTEERDKAREGLGTPMGAAAVALVLSFYRANPTVAYYQREPSKIGNKKGPCLISLVSCTYGYMSKHTIKSVRYWNRCSDKSTIKCTHLLF